jgi:hypothetical protein
MMEKTSENIVCIICGKPATCEVAGKPCCDDCKNSDEIKQQQTLIESFEG